MLFLLLTLRTFHKFIYVSVVSFVFTKLLGNIPTKKETLTNLLELSFRVVFAFPKAET